ncbi:helix-turn-helix transcriptional regulator [Melissococcus plutonius]|uniref:helix-turn-helix domain-containing protein n=1 Tax=Melissococcus plutonius TaxID=33970 RepID=UPI0021E5EC31|nr:helix-turn-helix transcriptional regulator [Melissococcus plutonius]MCV2499508.1 helix-turn-helix domain-containing protein [Melissococcus plutonius]MCV2501917.1 helix-turn-helix domain-containing protein [Melissococcus plutonius]MCV2505840.1 helix-turn-helix domain-containing protein [Melissococcus plutonius]MCV2508265.1 helix-turn-helix domain-containing protein [Melissococcus plutonius]MCV2520671.1 helix-turn-helix domain-containing protein [Melissococcus plutonius]
MTAFDRLRHLCEKNGISINDLEDKIGIGKNSLYSWKKNIPKGTNLLKVADYFNVSTDYLLGRTDNPGVKDGDTTNDLDEMLDNVMSFDGKPMTDHDREVIRAFLKGKFDED